MRNLLYAANLVVLLLVCCTSVQATHIIGLDVWHKDIGNDQYQLSMGQYIDCDGIASQAYIPLGSSSVPVAWIYNTFPNNCTVVLDTGWQITSVLDVTPICPSVTSNCINVNSPVPGVAYFEHTQTISITNCTTSNPTVELGFSNCCRPSTITSLLNPSNEAIALIHTIYPGITNSSPEINAVSITVCDGQSGSYFLGGVDPDFDSLYYTLTTPSGSLTTPVQYAPGFSTFSPLGAGWSVSLNSQTGILNVSPTTGGLQQGVISVKIFEYRGGQLIGTTHRDMSISVVNCNGNSAPTIVGISNVSGGNLPSSKVIDYCVGSTLNFDVVVADSNTAQSLNAVHSISQALPGASVSMSGTNPLTLSVSWTPIPTDTATRFFHVSASDNGCPYGAISSEVFYLTSKGTCIDASITGTNCQDSTGSIAILMNGGVGPFSYLWSNGATSPAISNLTIGSYTVVVVDISNGAVFTETYLLTADDVILNSTVTVPDCNTPSGSIFLGTSGGNAPYSYTWNTGATGDSVTNLSPGGYSVIVTDSIGCFQQGIFILDPPDSCFVTISGKVYHDLNGNCIPDSGEIGLAGILLNYTPGGMILTDSNGFYSFLADTGLTTVKVFSNYLSGAICPDSINATSTQYGSSISSVDFGVDTVLFEDLAIQLYSGPAVWNGSVKYTLFASNNGMLVTLGTTKTLTYPSGLTPTGFYPTPSLIDTVNKTITWNTGAIAPTQSKSCHAYFALDSTFNLNDSLYASASIGLLGNEVDSANNYSTDIALVVGAYDPNDKQVSPIGIREEGFILPTTSTLDYKIRFQNTGNYPATYVVLRDTISSLLDLSQYRTLGFSHPFALTVEEDSIMVFTFANINLPDSMSDPLGSQGFVEFQLGLQASLPVGTTIENGAAIYFDFNPPIFTNTVLNTIYTQPDVELTEQPFYCVGDPIFANLIATGKPPYTFDWNFGGPSTTNDTSDVTLIFQSDWYVVTVTDDFGFSDTDSVLVNTVPPIFADFDWELTGNGFQVAFADSSNDGNSYLWRFGTGDSSIFQNPFFLYPQPGEYEVMLIVTNECASDTAIQTVFINNDGIDTWPFEPISVQPNPFTNSTQVLFPMAGNWSLTLVDLRGKTVYEGTVSGSSATIDRGSLSDGIYYLEVSDGEHWDRRKVLITD